MKVCTFYESRLGRNDGPPLYWTNAMREVGIEVVHLSSRNLPDARDGYDAYLWVDWGEDGLVGALPYTPISLASVGGRKIYIASDTHLGFDYRFEKSAEFTEVYCNQKSGAEEFIEKGRPARWLPHAYEPRAYPHEPKCIKKYDVCFVGHVGFENRANFLDVAFKAFPNFWYGQAFFEEAALIYRQSRVVLNPPVKKDLNMRFFESWGAGSFSLTEYIDDLASLQPSIPGDIIDKISYEDYEDAMLKVQWALDHPKEREEIVDYMQRYTFDYHSYQARVKNMFLEHWREKDGKKNVTSVT